MSTPAESLEPVQILLVDDRPENLLALTAILNQPGYRLITASSGREALHVALREPLAVILLDAIMPDMDGFEVARHLKQLERTRYVPILFLTALATGPEQLYRAYEAGAVDYLVKPLDAELVRRKVEVFVQLARQRVAIERQAQLLREAQRRDYELRVAELRVASDRRYRKLVEGIDHVIAWSANAHARLTFVSRQASDITGIPIEDFLQPDFWSRHLHPADREEVLARFRHLLEQAHDASWNHRLIAGDGTILWFHTSVSAERSSTESGEDGELHGISIDITEMKRNEEMQALLADVGSILSESLQLSVTLPRLAERVVETLGDYCFIDEVPSSSSAGEPAELAAVHRESSKRALLARLARRPLLEGAEGHEGIARVAREARASFHARVPDAGWLARALGSEAREVLALLGATSCMFVPLRARDQVLAVLTLVSSGAQHRLRTSDLVVVEEVCRRAALAMDNTILFAQARRSMQAREELLAVVSHDLRNPLSAIMMSSRVLERAAQRAIESDAPLDAAKVLQGAGTIQRSAERMERMIGDLLDFARAQGAQIQLEYEAVPVSRLIEESLEMFMPLASEKEIALTSEVLEGLEAFCDRERVLRVLSNLIGNAIKFTPNKGAVQIHVSAREDGVLFMVADTGIGLSADELERIWERFWQAGERGGTNRGIGLGLSIARSLVEAHGGRIWAESEPGGGTRFYFTLPPRPAR